MQAVTIPEVADWLNKAVANDEFWSRRHEFDYEKRIALSLDGKVLKDWRRCEVMVILDRIGLIDGVVEIEDLKSNTPGFERDNPTERDTYVAAARKLYPDQDRFRFSYFYPRAPKRVAWLYTYETENRVVVTGPKGETETHEADTDPLWKRIIDRLAEIRATEPVPTPGAHCTNWYGQPCQFLGNGCPLGDQLPEILRDVPVVESPLDLDGLNHREKVWTAFVHLLAGDDHITPEIASLALQGVQQLSGAVKAVDKVLRSWSSRNGPIAIGPSEWGYVTTLKPGIKSRKVTALKMIHGSGGWKAAAKAVNISPSSVKRLGKREYGDLCDVILHVCGEQVEETVWQEVPDDLREMDGG